MIFKWYIVLLTASLICCEEILENNIALEHPDQNLINEISESDSFDHVIKNVVENIANNIEENSSPSEDTDISEERHINDQLHSLNTTIINNETKVNVTHKVALCKRNIGGQPVEIVNGTQLIKILLADANVTKDLPGECVLILFYAKFCTFSSMAAPHFNALSRAFPDIKMAAIDAMKYHFFNTQNGIVGVPTLLLFHNGRPIGKFNDTEYTLDLFSKFVMKYTGLQPIEKSYVTSADFAGPVSSTPEKETDYFLGLSWLFIIVCGVYYFSKSRWWKWIVEIVQNTWRESEAQHEHND